MKRLFIAISACLLCVTPAMADVVRDFESASDNILVFNADSIDYRKNLTRVYGHLTGRPHTSNRIDGAKMMVNGIAVESMDIDGVDFRRYFQWEDDGSIYVEIDFPAVQSSNGIQFLFETARGQSVTTLRKITKKHK